MRYGPEYAGLETSDEILSAIEKLYDGSVLDHDSEAYRQWADPEDIMAINRLAWKLADDDTTELYFGEITIRKG